MISKYFFLALLTGLISCIGTDIVEYQVEEVLKISLKADSIKIGEMFTYQAEYFNSKGENEQVDITWMSADQEIVSIDMDGKAIAISEGKTFITASYKDLIDSSSVVAGDKTIVGGTDRNGSLMGFNDYEVSGNFVLYEDKGDLIFKLEDNFKTSNGPGLHVYLTNQLTGVAGGADLGGLMANQGGQEYLVPGSVSINTYDYVIIYCKPFGVVFGNGAFEN